VPTPIGLPHTDILTATSTIHCDGMRCELRIKPAPTIVSLVGRTTRHPPPIASLLAGNRAKRIPPQFPSQNRRPGIIGQLRTTPRLFRSPARPSL